MRKMKMRTLTTGAAAAPNIKRCRGRNGGGGKT